MISLLKSSCTNLLFTILEDVSVDLKVSRVKVRHSVVYLDWTLRCGWFVVRCGSKKGHQKDMCLKKIELYAQNN